MVCSSPLEFPRGREGDDGDGEGDEEENDEEEEEEEEEEETNVSRARLAAACSARFFVLWTSPVKDFSNNVTVDRKPPLLLTVA